MGILSIFRTIHTIYSVVSLIVLLVILYGVALIYTAGQTEVKDVTVESISNITKDGFTLNGGVTVRNGGIVTLHVTELTYTLTLDEKKLDLGEGAVEGARLLPKDEQRFTFSHRVNLSKTVAQAISLQGNQSNIDIEGDVVLDHFGLYQSKLHYKKSFDLIGTIANGAEELAPVALATANSFLNTVNELLN